VLKVVFLGMPAKRRRTMEDDNAQELFLDISSEDELVSHDSDQDETQQDDSGQKIHSLNVVHL
jgi:hypothetical protein